MKTALVGRGKNNCQAGIGIITTFTLIILTGSGCSGTHKTTKTETTTTYPNKGVVYQGGQQATTPVTTSDDQEAVAKVVTTSTTETKDEHPGILGATLHAIGYVISIPFIIIGGVFRTIFGG